jgi:hypothetical protein
VAKPVRAGFTTSCIHACKERNERLLILAPTGRILKETVSSASPGNIRIPGNIECPFIQESVRDNQVLAKLPLFLPDCDQCNASEWCDVREILRAEDFQTVSLTSVESLHNWPAYGSSPSLGLDVYHIKTQLIFFYNAVYSIIAFPTNSLSCILS